MRVRVGVRGAIALSQLLIAGGIVAGGVGAGVGLQQAGVIGGDETIEVALDAVPTLDCPGGSEVGEVHRGDRVLATAKDDAGDFIEVRDPRNLSDRVWVDTRYLVPDASLSGLDVHECAVPTAVAPPTTLPPDVTTTTEGGGGSSGGGGGGSSGGGGGGTTPTTPADTAGPTIGPIGANPTAIKEQYNDGSGFNCGGPSTSTISAAVSDPSGIASVTMAWQVSTTSGSKPMAGSGTYSATLGPFNQNTIPQSTSAQINVTVTAVDTKGNSRVATRTVTLNDCTFF